MGAAGDWVQRAALRTRQRLQSIIDSAQPMVSEFPDVPRGWISLGVFYDCIQDPMYPYDPAVLRAVQEIVPGAAPLRVLSAFRSPYDEVGYEVCYFRHGLGVYEEDCPEEARLSIGAMPTVFPGGVAFPRPNRIKHVFQYKRKDGSDLPGAFFPFDWGAYHWVYDLFGGHFDQEDQGKAVEGKVARKKARAEALRDEDAYRKRDLGRYAEGQLSRVSDVEHKEYALGGLPRKNRAFVYVKAP